MPPKVMPRPKVIPDAKPMLFDKYCWPNTTMGLYWANTPKANGTRSAMDSQYESLWVKRIMMGTKRM